MTNPRTLIVDLPVSNSKALYHALSSLGITSVISNDVTQIREAERIILPGVGSFDRAVKALNEMRIFHPLKEAVSSGTPTLGVCLGLQLLCNSSGESLEEEGLGFIPLHCRQFPSGNLKVPHVGWNEVQRNRESHLFSGIPSSFAAYFCHSYYVPINETRTVASCTYGSPFSAIIASGNVFGLQFHPERSQKNGLKLLNNFILETC